MVREIPLTRGMVAIVDDEDYDKVAAFRWHAARTCAAKDIWYARRTIRDGGKKRIVAMHQIILPLDPPLTSDHINGNGLDNRRCNLRPATLHQQAMNLRMKRTNKSGFIGVHWSKSQHAWIAMIRINRVAKYLGHFQDPKQAAETYDRVARETRGEFAKLNFPTERMETT